MPRSSTNAVTPLCPFARSTDAKTRKWSAMSARLIQIFWPLSTYESPSRRAVVARLPASVPTPGSVSPNVASFSPLRLGHEPALLLLLGPPLQERQRVEPDMDALDDPERRVGPLELLAEQREADVVHPGAAVAPPGSARRGSPSSPIRAKTSRWTSPFSSHSRMWGRISASAKARADCWTRRFSSVRRSRSRVDASEFQPRGRAFAGVASGHPVPAWDRSHPHGRPYTRRSPPGVRTP